MIEENGDGLGEATDRGATREPRRSADSSDRAYNEIRERLVEFRLKPDQRLNELKLSREFGLSRTPIREALNRLASEGFLTVTPNKGFFVRSLSIEGTINLYELRSIIECAGFRLLCERADDEQIARLATFWSKVVDGYGDNHPDVILTLDEEFHTLICELSGNPEIVTQLVALNARIRFIRRIQIKHSANNSEQINSHTQIVAAALARDAERGVALLREHIEMTMSAASEALKDALLRANTLNSSSIAS
jgi:DNA-binding GntR family transcriptional regulator